MNVFTEKKIGANIRTLREKMGFTQEQLSAKLQVNGCDITRSAMPIYYYYKLGLA